MAAVTLSLYNYRPAGLSSSDNHQSKSVAAAAATTGISTVVASNRSKSTRPQHPCLVLLEKCSTLSELKQIHAQMLRTGLFSDPFTAANIVAFAALGESGSLDYARLVLTQIPNPSSYAFNSIIRGFTNKKLHREAVLFYRELIVEGLVPDRFTFPSLFMSCKDLSMAKQLHCHSTKFGFASDSYIQNTLMNMYSKSGCLVSAHKVFDKMSERTKVSWATMIGAYTQCGQSGMAIKLFGKMENENVKPDEVSLIHVLTACAKLRDLNTTRRVHRFIDDYGYGSHELLITTLVDAYSKCGSLPLAKEIFNRLPRKSLVGWNVMINGHVEGSDYEGALQIFREMQLDGVKGDEVTMVGLLLACTHLGALELGKWLHLYIKRERIEVDVPLATALVDMYCKCGSIDIAEKVFNELREKDVMTWTALIIGLAMSGQGEKALQYFHQMEAYGLRPDAITFIGVLAACSHAGLVEKGIAHFESMYSKYGIRPGLEHYGAMVDMLGRAGRIAEAEEMIQTMPVKPDRYVLGGLLGACRIHDNLQAAERVAQRLLEIEPDNGGVYVLLSNIYSSQGKREEAKRTRDLMAGRNVKKLPGCSLIEVGGAVHEFVKGDSSHAQSSEIYKMLEDMMSRIKEAGYVPNKAEVMLEVGEEEKETELSLHSEKLAIAFGLLSTSPRVPIRVVKNLRVCNDCHTATKLISKVYDREIIVRDRNRFHHFKDGSCSCKDFW